MRIGSPGNYVCNKSGDRGMHRWFHNGDGFGECRSCGLVLDATDTADCFSGSPTPLGSVRLPPGWNDATAEQEED